MWAMRGWGLTVLRVAVGTVIVAHGLQALVPVWGGSPSPSVADLWASDGPAAMAVGLAQSAGGLLLLAGAYTSIVSLVLALERLAALWLFHLANGFFLNWSLTPGTGHGIEYHLLTVAVLACLVLEGAGELSYDAHRHRLAEADALGRARIRARTMP